MKKIIACLLVITLVLIPVSSFSSFAQNEDNPFEKEDSIRSQAIEISNSQYTEQEDTSVKINTEDISALENVDYNYTVKFKSYISLREIYNCVSLYQYKLMSESKERVFALKIDNISLFNYKYGTIIEYASQSKERTLSAIPNDTYYSKQWAIPDMNLPAAWDSTKGAATVKVGVIDTGFYRNHEDLSNTTVLNGYDVVANSSSVTSDEMGHGTMVTSVIAAATNNSKGMAGVCWNITVLPYKVAKADETIDSIDVINAIRMAADDGCDVINISLGGYEQDTAEQAAIDYAVGKGCIIVASAGNEGDDSVYRGKLSYPASDTGVISAAAVSNDNQIAYFSQYNSEVDVCAPGEDIVVATADGTNSYALAAGTSFSSPYVAAVAALARSVESKINAEYFEQLIQTTSTDLGSASRDNYYGWGLINADNVVDKAVYPIVSGVVNNKSYNTDKTITFNKGTATLNGKAFTSGTTVTAQGEYTLIITDSSQRATTVRFFIDKSNLAVSGIEDGKTYNKNVTITFNNGTATLNGNTFTSGTVVSNEGSYVLQITGVYGYTATYNFTIDKTAPVVTGAVNGGIYNNPVTITFSDGTATMNGNAFTSGSTVYLLGNYTLIVTDIAGNKTTVSFSLSIGSNISEISMPSDITQWVMDETNNMLCAVSSANNTLYFINAGTFNIDETVTLAGSPTDIIFDSGKLYIALDAVNKIAVVDVASQTVEKTLVTTTDPYRIVKDGQKLFYVGCDQLFELHEYDLDTDINTNINAGVIYNPDLAVNNDQHILYIGESGSSGSHLTYYSISENKIIGETAYYNNYGYYSPARVTLFDGENVYYAGRSFSADSPLKINGDFNNNQTVIASELGCVFTSSGIYDRETYLKSCDLSNPITFVESLGNDTLFTYNSTYKKITKYISTTGEINSGNITTLAWGTPAAEIPAVTQSSELEEGTKGLTMNSELTQWVIDDEKNIIYAISQKDKALFFISSKTLNITNVIRFKSGPTDITLDNGNLYIALDDAFQIKVIDIDTKIVTKTIHTSSDPCRIVVDGNKLFYAELDQHCDIYEYNLETSTDKKIYSTAYCPDLAINTEQHILYIGESQCSGCQLVYYDTENGNLIKDSGSIYTSDRNIVFDGTYVLYSRQAFDPLDMSVVGTFDTTDDIIQAKYGLVFTKNEIFDEETFESLGSFDSTVNLVELSDSFDLFTYDKTNKVILRYQGFEEPYPEITGVTDGGKYLDEVTVSFDLGTAELDGEEFISGSKVTALGEHTLTVFYNSMEYTVTFTIVASIAGDNTPVTFNDGNLKAALIGAGFDGNNDIVISQGELRIQSAIYISSCGITDLTGLEYAKNLTELDISGNSITDISALSAMTQLQYLDIDTNTVEDISPLSGLSNLIVLYAYANLIEDITPLSGLSDLRSLIMDDNKISDISPLKNLTGLGSNYALPGSEELDCIGGLSLSDNLITDISPIANLTNLTILDLSGNTIESISSLSKLTKLTSLALAKNKISDISPLSNITALGTDDGFLALQNNLITDISPLSDLTNLFDLDLSNNALSSIEALSSLTNLNYLTLDGIGISDFKPLEGLTGLVMLGVNDNNISDISFLKNLNSLVYIGLANNKISNIGIFADKTLLQGLDLSHNQIRDISPLEKLNELFLLDLSYNRLEEINSLGNLESMYSLNLSNNEIADLSPIENLAVYLLDVSQNYLDITDGSDARSYIDSLLENGSQVTYEPQKDISLDIAPVITVGDYNKQPTNHDITVTVTSDKGKLNAESHTFTENGSYDFIATDSAGKSTKVTVTITNIDKTAPVVTGAASGGTYDDEVTLSFNEGTATVDNNAFASGSKITGQGAHTISVIDAAGNKTEFSFSIITAVVTNVSAKSGNSLVFDNNSHLLTGFNTNKTLSYFNSLIVPGSGSVRVLNSSGQTITDNNTIIGTGCKLQQLNASNQVLNEFTVVVLGDISGDGAITITDFLKIKAYLLKKETFNNACSEAADINNDGNITITDFLKVKADLLNKEKIHTASESVVAFVPCGTSSVLYTSVYLPADIKTKAFFTL